jgi:HK97 family phage prohead protease/HK97 family phage major capsid protein
MKKIFNLTSQFKAIEKEDDGSIIIEGMASTIDVDRAGDIIVADAWTKGGLDNYKKNPVILFNHNYNRPIGRAIEITPTDKGLKLKVKISSGAGDILKLIKDEVLNAFSVGFMVKDADFDSKTGIFVIKDAHLLETSVVSVPCNQEAIFSVAKSFDSDTEYTEFKDSFITREAQGSVAKEEVNTSLVAIQPSVSVAKLAIGQEKLMTPEEIQAMITKAAADLAEKTAAEARAKAAAEAAEQNARNQTVTIVKTAAEELMKDIKKDLADKDASMATVLATYKAELEKNAAEIESLRKGKVSFTDRKGGDLTNFGKDFLAAKMLGVVTNKGFNTNFANQVFEKAGVNYTTSAADVDQTVQTQIEKEIRVQLKLASAFREVPVSSGTTIIPIQPNSGTAAWTSTGVPSGNLQNNPVATANQFNAKQISLICNRLISSTYLDNDVEEQVLVAFMPMLVDAVIEAHARAVDAALINGNGANIAGLAAAATVGASTLSIGSSALLTAAILNATRKKMGKYGLDTSDLVYCVNQSTYFDLTQDPEFKDITSVGSDKATKITGTVGSVYGVPVVVSDNFPTIAATAPAALAINVKNYLIGRLRGVTLEQDYEVGNQRKLIVASQSLGFQELVAGAGLNYGAVRVNYAA